MMRAGKVACQLRELCNTDEVKRLLNTNRVIVTLSIGRNELILHTDETIDEETAIKLSSYLQKKMTDTSLMYNVEEMEDEYVIVIEEANESVD